MEAKVTIFVGRKRVTVDSDQLWFWTASWQAAESQATRDIRAGRTTRFDSDHEFLKSLE